MCPGMQSISFHRNLHQAKWVQRGSVSASHKTKWIEDLAKVYSARSGFQVSNLSEYWQVAWQHCCQATCQVSKGFEHFNTQYRRFETLQDLAIRHYIVYWHGLYYGLWSYFVCVCVSFLFFFQCQINHFTKMMYNLSRLISCMVKTLNFAFRKW